MSFLSNMDNDTKEIMEMTIKEYPNFYIGNPVSPLNNCDNHYSINKTSVYDSDSEFWNYFNKLKKYIMYKKYTNKQNQIFIVKFEENDNKIGEVVYVEIGYKPDTGGFDGVGYSSSYWSPNNFKPLTIEDIKLLESKLNAVKGEMKMKNVLLKTITGKSLVKENACDGEVNKYIKKFGYLDVLNWNEENEKWIEDNISGGIKFLLEKGFIEEDNKLKFDSRKLYFVKDYAGDVCRLCFDRIIGEYRWVAMNKNESYRSRDTFEEANEKFIENQENNYYSDFEIKTFDTLEEAMKFYYPEEKKEATKKEDFKEMRRLFEKYNFKSGCNIFEDECEGIACGQCPAGNR